MDPQSLGLAVRQTGKADINELTDAELMNIAKQFQFANRKVWIRVT